MSHSTPAAFELHGIGYSSWTEKARWALHHHRIPYRYREHLIWLGMPALAARAGLPPEEITLPILLKSDQGPIVDSLEIARFAEKWRTQNPDSSSTEELFPEGLLPEIKHYNLLSELLISRARLRLCHAILESPQAQEAMAPTFVPAFLRPLTRPLVRKATLYIMQEFDLHKKRPSEMDSMLIQALVGLNSAIEKAQGGFLLDGKFTYADITTAVALGSLRPIQVVFDRLSEQHKKILTDSQLAASFPALLAWRDRVYREKNPKFKAASAPSSLNS